MKIRYSRQIRDFDCGPVAVANALKWAGQKISYRHNFRQLCKRLKVDKEGTVDCTIRKALVSLDKSKLQVKRVYKLNLVKIRKELTKGKAIIISSWGNGRRNVGALEGHYSLLIGTSKKFVTAVNYANDCPTTGRITYATLRLGNVWRGRANVNGWLITKTSK